MFTNSRELSKCTDKALKEYCEGKENCRRKVLLAALGSTQEISQHGVCCDTCPSGELPRELSFVTPLRQERQRRARPVRVVSVKVLDSLKKRLLEERAVITSSSLGYRTLGQEVILPTKCIEQICKKARHIQSINDIRLPGIRTSVVAVTAIAGHSWGHLLLTFTVFFFCLRFSHRLYRCFRSEKDSTTRSYRETSRLRFVCRVRIRKRHIQLPVT